MASQRTVHHHAGGEREADPAIAPAPRRSGDPACSRTSPQRDRARPIARWVSGSLVGALCAGTLASCGGAASDASTSSAPVVAPASTPAEDPDAALIVDARRAAARGQYALAFSDASLAGRDALADRYRTLGLSRARRNAERALAAADPQRALVIVRSARRGYETPGALAVVASDARILVAERHARKVAAARAKAVAKAAARAERKRVALAAEQAAEAADAAPAASNTDYAGMTCPEIGHSFPVEPGSDQAHDADNDGMACESQ